MKFFGDDQNTTPVAQVIDLLADLVRDQYQDLQIILTFYEKCWDLGKWDNPPEPELWNPLDPEMVAQFAIPKGALDVFRSMRSKSYYNQDVIHLDRCMRIANVADDLHLSLCVEAIAQILVEAIRDKSPEEIQVMRGKMGIWTPAMEAEVIRDHPWLA